MKNLKRLSAVAALTVILGANAFAGEVNAPPCAQPIPGEVNAPPCAEVPFSNDDPNAPGQILTPTASDPVDIIAVIGLAMNELLFF